MASGTSPQSAAQQSQQHLTPDIRDPSGPDGSSSVGYMGLDFHGIAVPSASPGALTEGPQVPCSTEEPFQHHHEHLGSFGGLHRGQHPGKFSFNFDKSTPLIQFSVFIVSLLA